MSEKHSLALEIFWIQDGPVQPIRFAPDPAPSSAFSLAPAKLQRLRWQQESGLASSGFVFKWASCQRSHLSIVFMLSGEIRQHYTLLLCSAVIRRRGRELFDFICMYRYRYNIQK